jgi:hypothetical protein
MLFGMSDDHSHHDNYNEQDGPLDTKLGIAVPLVAGLLIGLLILLVNQ